MWRLLTLLCALFGFAAPSGALATEPPSHARASADSALPAPRASIVGELRTEHFRFLYTERAEVAAKDLAEKIEPIAADLSTKLGVDWTGVTEIRVGMGRQEYEDLALPGGKPPSWSLALAYPDAHLVLIEVEALGKAGGFHNLRHELVHIALGRIAHRWPRWFHEGLAAQVTGERDFQMGQYTTLVRAVAQERIFSFDDLDRTFPEDAGDVDIAYAQSAAFVRFLGERHGLSAFAKLFERRKAGEDFHGAFAKAFGTTVELEEEAFAKELPKRYSVLPLVTGGTTVMVLAALLSFVGYLRRKRRHATRLEEMAEEERREAELQAELLALEAAVLEEQRARAIPESNAPGAVREPGESEGLAERRPEPDEAPEKPTLH